MKNKNVTYLEFYGIVGAALLAIICGFVIILFISNEPFTAISSFLLGPFASWFNIGTLLNKAVPLIFTGLAVAVMFQAGVFSLGAEGQLYIGGFIGAVVAVNIHGLTPWFHIPLILICAIIGGALYGAIPGLLKVYFNANEIVTTLMLNFVATLSTSYFVNNVLKDPMSSGYARMHFIEKENLLSKMIPGFSAHYGVLIALLTVVLAYMLLYMTKIGYEMRLVGKNSRFANYGGISIKKVIINSVMIGGGIAGLAGIVEILGIHGTYKDNFSSGLGFDGIIIALLARNHPIGVLMAAIFYAYIQLGAQIMQVESDVPRELAVIVQALLVLFVCSQAVFTYLKQRNLTRQKEGKIDVA